MSKRRTGSPSFTSVPSGAMKAILNSTSGTGGTADLAGAHRLELAVHLDGEDEVAAGDLSPAPRFLRPEPASRAASKPGSRAGSLARMTTQRGVRRQAGPDAQKRETRSPSSRSVILIEDAVHGRRAGGEGHRHRLVPARPADHRRRPPRSGRRRGGRRGRRSIRPAHHLDPHRQAWSHEGVGGGEGDAHREAGARAGPATAGLRRHRADLGLLLAVEHPVGVGVEDASDPHPGGRSSRGQASVSDRLHLHRPGVGDASRR